MSYRKAKTAPKIYISDKEKLKKMVLNTLKGAADIVGATLGPGGKNVLIESNLPGLPNTNTKDGVTVLKSLGAVDPATHVILEQMRDSASRTATEAGDGPCPMYSKLLTPKGFIEMRDVKIGTKICGTNGTIQEVVGVFPKGQKEIYEVEIEKKGIIECCADHLWDVSFDNGNREVRPLSSLIKDYKKIGKDGCDNYKYYIPRTYVEFYENKSEMPLDPYLVGVLLGDGSLRDSGSIELSLGIKKKHIIDKLIVPKGINIGIQYVESKNCYRVKFSGTDNTGKSMRSYIESIGLRNADSFTKFIPKSYLKASKKNREKLLQGLIDTDGTIRNSGRFEFNTVSNELADDISELMKSLGMTVGRCLKTRSTENGCYSNTPIHRIYELKGYKYGDKIVRITPTGKFTEMQCIKVSNPDNLYIMDNYVVTHNTTSSTLLTFAITDNMFAFCEQHPKYSPQKAVRRVKKVLKDIVLPYIESRSVKITEENKELLRMVAKISANGDGEMADAVIQAFEEIGFGDASHVTIREMTGKSGFKVERIDGFPIPIGYEESIGKLHTVFINDQANLRCYLEKPLFLLFDGHINDIVNILPIINGLGKKYVEDMDSDYKNLVIVAHGFSEAVLTNLAYNFADPGTINVLPLITPKAQFANSQQQALLDIAAFTGAKVFGIKDQIQTATLNDLGAGMESFECYRFRSTVVGDPDPTNIEVRADELKKMKENAESNAESIFLEERIGKITNGIAKITVFGGSNGELKEMKDRVEDAVCAVRSTISHGALPGGCRIGIDIAHKLTMELEEGDPAREILMPSLMQLPQKLLDNAGYNSEEIQEILKKLIENPDLVYDVENETFGKAEELGLFDATKAVSESLSNAASIAGVLGTMGGIVFEPRDDVFERSEAKADSEFMKTVENPELIRNEANERP